MSLSIRVLNGSWMLLWSVTVAPLRAHDSPERVVEELTRAIAERGKSPELLFRRATEYRDLRRWKIAEADYSDAIALDPGFILAWTELSRTQKLAGHPEAALETIECAIRKVPDETGRGALYQLRSEIHVALGQPARALRDSQRAVELQPDQQDWLLRHGRLLLALGKPKEAALALQAGFERIGGVVLETEWVETLLDAGQFETALDRVREPLAASRLRSSWLIRRARAHMGLGASAEAVSDLETALNEISERLRPERPDLSLLVDQGMALALLGEKEAAREALARARQGGADDFLCFRLELTLKPTADPVRR